MPASAGHAITDVPKPVASTAELYASSFVAAVMITEVTHAGKASANVLSIFTPLISISKYLG
jgi:hypothetical protein